MGVLDVVGVVSDLGAHLAGSAAFCQQALGDATNVGGQRCGNGVLEAVASLSNVARIAMGVEKACSTASTRLYLEGNVEAATNGPSTTIMAGLAALSVFGMVVGGARSRSRTPIGLSSLRWRRMRSPITAATRAAAVTEALPHVPWPPISNLTTSSLETPWAQALARGNSVSALLSTLHRALTFYFGEHYRYGSADARPLQETVTALHAKMFQHNRLRRGELSSALRELGACVREWNGWKIALEGDVSDREEGLLCMSESNRRVQDVMGKIKGLRREPAL